MKLTLVSTLAACAAIGALSLSASAQTFTTATPGLAGAIPPSGSGGGTYNKATNCTPGAGATLIVPISIPVAVASVDQITLVVDVLHSWVGDVHIVLCEPGATKGYNIMVRPGFNSAGAAGNSGDMTVGTFKFVTAASGLGGPVPHTAATNMPAGVYTEDFGDPAGTGVGGPWTAGNTIGTTLVVGNGMPTGVLPSGTWELRIYDWVGGDVGHISSASISVNGLKPTPPTTSPCGAPNVNSEGCIPATTATGISSASLPSGFNVTTTQIRAPEAAVYFYGLATTSVPFGPFQTRCVDAPKRAAGTTTGGIPNQTPDCGGIFTLDFNTFRSGGYATPLIPAPFLSVPSTVVHVQFWGRDNGYPIPDNYSLGGNLLTFTVGP